MEINLSQEGRDTPTFSVVIPALNAAGVIPRCLEGLEKLKAGFGAFEVIVVDNGSTDNTLAAVRAFESRLNLRLLEKPGVPISAARNHGAAAANGRYLAFLDADCIPAADWLHRTRDHITDSPVDVTGARYAIPEDSSWVARTWHRHQEVKIGPVSYIPGGNLIISKARFLQLGGFDETIETNEDYEFCQRAICAGLRLYAFPDLAVCHLGEAQTLSRFYKKQRWHGRHVFRVFLRGLPKMRNLRSVVFAFYYLFCLAGLISGLALASVGRVEVLCASAAAMIAAPVMVSARATLSRHRPSDLPALSLLFLTFGLARALCLVDISRSYRK
jgi:glycosyltransferase involved in cell wall biosynthesis